MSIDNRPIIGVTLGDAAGISPEIVVRLFDEQSVIQMAKIVVIGDARIVQKAVQRFSYNKPQVIARDSVSQAVFEPATIEVLDMANLAPSDYREGEINASCGKAFVEWIRTSAKLAIAGEIDAIASAPTNKEAMHLSGHIYPGQTEIYAQEGGIDDFFTVLVGGGIRCFLNSTHISLLEAIKAVTPANIERVLRWCKKGLSESWGITHPTIAVAGLNPHAGDGGLFGTEEIEIITPVIDKLRAEGLDIIGVQPSDSLFLSADNGAYDGVVAMYHDQGVIPLKRHGYVTTMIGANFVRTTAGHGSAYDIAGKGVADATVMAKAVKLAGEIAIRRGNIPF